MMQLLPKRADSKKNKRAVEMQKMRSQRSVMRRSNTFTLKDLSAAEVTKLIDDTVNKKTLLQILKPYIPIILW